MLYLFPEKQRCAVGTTPLVATKRYTFKPLPRPTRCPMRHAGGERKTGHAPACLLFAERKLAPQETGTTMHHHPLCEREERRTSAEALRRYRGIVCLLSRHFSR